MPRRRIEERGLQLSVFVGASRTAGGRPLYHEVIDRALQAGLPGATVLRGMQGFDAPARSRREGRGSLGGHEPVLIEITATPAQIWAFLPSIDQLPGVGLILLRELTVLRLARAPADARALPVPARRWPGRGASRPVARTGQGRNSSPSAAPPPA
jgi:uncharacterized protein